MSTRGSKKGERRGGRTKGTPNKNRDEVIALIDKIAKKRYGKEGEEFIFTKLFELGEGVTVQGENKDGTVYVIDKEPNVKALETLAAYRHGKPPQSIDVTSDNEKLTLSVYLPQKQ